MSAFAPWSTERAEVVVTQSASRPGPVLLTLQALQREFGYVHPDAVPLVARTLNVSRAEVHGVLTYYHDLRTSPAPSHSVRVCVAEACQSVGSRDVVQRAEGELGVSVGERSSDSIDLEAVYCLGNCALGPAALVDGQLLGRLSPSQMADVIGALRSESA